jgi:hypothetical protein
MQSWSLATIKTDPCLNSVLAAPAAENKKFENYNQFNQFNQ